MQFSLCIPIPSQCIQECDDFSHFNLHYLSHGTHGAFCKCHDENDRYFFALKENPIFSSHLPGLWLSQIYIILFSPITPSGLIMNDIWTMDWVLWKMLFNLVVVILHGHCRPNLMWGVFSFFHHDKRSMRCCQNICEGFQSEHIIISAPSSGTKRGLLKKIDIVKYVYVSGML